jgi:hypothetical protein
MMSDPMLATVVDTQALLRTIAAAFVAGVGVTFIFSLAIVGVARFAETNRDGHPLAAAAYGVLALIAVAVAAAAVTIGIIVMTRK